ncbi:MAG: GatB/YqeY domain-containing protein [Candidatus Taylorbacteria bacterium]|nr:GatB/YqeY domain-containing protein [Candidatus Taylorbacteria bacterium]
MSIHLKINNDAKEAMLKKEAVRSLVLKGVKAAFVNELMAQADPKKTELTDEEALSIIRRLVRQRKDSIDQFTKGGRPELAASEAAELKVLEAYLPLLMTEADIRKVANRKKSELGFSDKSKIGMLMSAVMKELKGKADGALVKKIVDEIIQ